MKYYFVVSLLVLGLFGSAAAQKLTNGGKPIALKTKKMNGAYIKFPQQNLFVLKSVTETDDDLRTFFEIKKADQTLGKIEASVNASGGSVDNFQAFYGDLDNNKSAELIVVDFDGQSNGLGIKYYTINIFQDFQTKGFTKPMSFTDDEFGASGTFVYDAAKRETLILLTEFRGFDKIDVKRGSGLYLTGKFFRYKSGMLKPAIDKPILARRYLNSFENERYKTENDPRTPYLWFSSPTTHKLTADPEFSDKPVSSQTGVIEKFEKIKEKYKPYEDENEMKEAEFEQITVKLDSGETKTIVLSNREALPELESLKNKMFPEVFGILPMKFALPTYLSPNLIVQDFEGKKVQLDSFKIDAESEPFYKLWFIEK